MSKTLTVKDLAVKYGVSANLIASELVRQGVKVDKAEKTKIPEDVADLIESYFDDLYGQQDEEALISKNNKRGNAPKKGNSRKEEVAMKNTPQRKANNAQTAEKGTDDKGNTVTLKTTSLPANSGTYSVGKVILISRSSPSAIPTTCSSNPGTN